MRNIYIYIYIERESGMKGGRERGGKDINKIIITSVYGDPAPFGLFSAL